MAVNTAPLYPPLPEIRHLTFRSSRIIYYGPHACGNCDVLICKMGHEFGGNAFTYPEGPIYPNTEWHPHVCDPKRVAAVPKASVAPTVPIPFTACRGESSATKATGLHPHCLLQDGHDGPCRR